VQKPCDFFPDRAAASTERPLTTNLRAKLILSSNSLWANVAIIVERETANQADTIFRVDPSNS
jgi:hypothetical protein